MHYMAKTSKVQKNKFIHAKQACYETKYGQPQL